MEKTYRNSEWWRWGKKSIVHVCVVLFLFLPFVSHGATDSVLLERFVTLSMKDVMLKDVIWEIEKQTDFVFVYNMDDLSACGKVSVDVKGKNLEEALKICLRNTGLTYVFQDDIIVICKGNEKKQQQPKQITIKGKVMDRDSVPLPGVTVLLKGTTLGVSTNVNGEYSLSFPEHANPVLVFSFVGMKTQEINIAGKKELNVVLEEERTEMDEVVITGVYTRKKESFTGSFQTYKAEELKSVGNQNLIQSLKVLDPAFAVLESNEFGSDPNRL
ncbi:MAG: carboxypeptidase-like regulatory domain-containing protein, partial [Marinifilaceae bacterium]|nr:carboxypeptidase-like regulatory domain-containing protein [Marinifilaceae bacterium]